MQLQSVVAFAIKGIQKLPGSRLSGSNEVVSRLHQ